MDRRTGDEWSGDPLLLAALQRYVERMLGELPCEEELSLIHILPLLSCRTTAPKDNQIFLHPAFCAGVRKIEKAKLHFAAWLFYCSLYITVAGPVWCAFKIFR